MNFNFLQINQKEVWEQNIVLFKEANFLQSWNWGVFQESMDKVVTRILVEEVDNIDSTGKTVALVQLVRETAKRGTYISIAGGPLVDWSNKELVGSIFDEIKKIAKEQLAIFIRFRPQALDSQELKEAVKDFGAIASKMHLTADLTLQLDLNQSEDEILAQMRKNTRYSVRKVEKEGIDVVLSKDKNEIKEFFDHQNELAKRHGFVPFSYDFLFNQFSAFAVDDQVILVHSYKDGKLLASAFIIFYNNEAVYHYGISTPDNGKLPGSYACQWAAIKEAKRRGCTKYNFWGIAPEDKKDHRFAGVSLFKRGFGGKEVNYLPSHDIPLSPKYYSVYLLETVRKKMRNL